MENVIIIKNNSKKNQIYGFAQESYIKQKQNYYFTKNNSSNEEYIKRIKTKFGKNGLILLITYEGQEENVIQDVFVGNHVEIKEDNNVYYEMKIHLERETEDETIQSIVDRIDLDISKDFDPDCYVIMSDMESLYVELKERLVTHRKPENYISDDIVNNIDEKPYQLNKLAQRDTQAIRIYKSETVDEYRTEFQRDRERVVNCKAFRRLVDKAQIFSADKGDYYRTRMTHSLEVNQIAKAIAYALNLNLDLTEAIALGHDLGHTPFGHQGERTLDEILSGKIHVGIVAPPEVFEERRFGGFKHNYQSAKILTQLEEKYVQYPGLNVSVQVVEGVLKHTEPKEGVLLEDFLEEAYIEKIHMRNDGREEVCATLEGQTVAIADEIAQRGHDVDDALTSGVMSIGEFIDRLKISKCDQLKNEIQDEMNAVDALDRLYIDKEELKIARIVSCIIHYMIQATIEFSKKNILENMDLKNISMMNTRKIIGFSEEVKKVNDYLERVVKKKVICNHEVAQADYNANMVVKTLFEKYYSNPRLLHAGTLHKMFIETLKHKNSNIAKSAINLNDGSNEVVNHEIKLLTNEDFDYEKLKKYFEQNDQTGIEKQVKIFEKRRIFIRCIVDYIAGMTDRYALEEYARLK